jgi:hypothetical protein
MTPQYMFTQELQYDFPLYKLNEQQLKLMFAFFQVRLNLLSTLLHEGFDYFHQHLTASVLGRKLFMLPFHRDVPITTQGAKAMLEVAKYCQQVRRAWNNNCWHCSVL